MAILLLKFLASAVLAIVGLLWVWMSFVGTLMSHETTKFKLADWGVIVVPPALLALMVWAMWS
ncbi:MAG: hypothetical protein COB49_09505 [Alphaproteobacteria bacterium]|nr:MAG: hypothetical protein COB49_09505 [Alphaproteobacteria bacterium]